MSLMNLVLRIKMAIIKHKKLLIVFCGLLYTVLIIRVYNNGVEQGFKNAVYEKNAQFSSKHSTQSSHLRIASKEPPYKSYSYIGWKQYANTANGYAFQYPVSDLKVIDYDLSKDNNDKYFVDRGEIDSIAAERAMTKAHAGGGGPWGEFMVSTETMPVAIQRIEKEITSGDYPDHVIKTTETIGNYTWQKIIDDSNNQHSYSYYYLLSHQNKTYILFFIDPPDYTYKQIVASFSFIN